MSISQHVELNPFRLAKAEMRSAIISAFGEVRGRGIADRFIQELHEDSDSADQEDYAFYAESVTRLMRSFPGFRQKVIAVMKSLQELEEAMTTTPGPRSGNAKDDDRRLHLFLRDFVLSHHPSTRRIFLNLLLALESSHS